MVFVSILTSYCSTACMYVTDYSLNECKSSIFTRTLRLLLTSVQKATLGFSRIERVHNIQTYINIDENTLTLIFYSILT